MQGFIPVEIPVKKYTKAYIIKKLGEKPIMSINGDNIAHKLFDLLQHKTNHRRTIFASKLYTETIRIYLPISTFKRRGAFLNETNIKYFNRYIEKELKNRFYELMDDMIEILPNFESNLPEIRRRLGIDIEAWADDSMRKDYYRYRLKRNKKLLYKK